MKRREFIAVLGTAASWSIVAVASFAQRPKIPRVGWLVPGSQAEFEGSIGEYRRGMRELGYIEGRTVETEYLFADAHFDRLPGLAAKLVDDKVDLIVTVSTPASLAAMRATDKIPIVFAGSSDPISTGVVASLAHPGGNVTGLSLMASDLSAKRLELIKAMAPRVSQIAVLWDSSNPGMALRVRETQAAAEQSKIAFFDAGARNLDELETVFSELLKRKPE